MNTVINRNTGIAAFAAIVIVALTGLTLERGHAGALPKGVIEVGAPETGDVSVDDVMTSVVQHARRLAHPGDTVLLAPACASMDMFTHYSERGDVFAAAVRRMANLEVQST